MLVAIGPRSRRKSDAQEKDAQTSHIPVEQSTSSALTTIPFNTPRPTVLEGKASSIRFAADRASIPFPKSPAPAVVTPLLVDARGRVNARLVEHPSQSKRHRRSPVSKSASTSEDAKIQIVNAPGRSVWTNLLTSGKGVIAQTLDRDLLQSQATPYCATMLTPQMLRAGLDRVETAYHAELAIKQAIMSRLHDDWDLEKILSVATEQYLVALGVELLEDVDGPHFTFVDPRFHDDERALIRQALLLMREFAKKGYRRDRIVISIPATEAGVQASKKLERNHFVRTNLVYVSGLVHAAICAEAGASFVTFSYTALSHGLAQKHATNPFARVIDALMPATKRLAEAEIEATAELFIQRKIETKVLLTGLQSLADTQRLKGFDSVVLDAIQSRQAKIVTPSTPPKRLNAPVESSWGKSRAREAELLSSCSAHSNAFMSAMSTEAREVARATLAEGLKEPIAHMHKASMHMLEFLQSEAQLAHMDTQALEELYIDDVNEAFRVAVLEGAGISARRRAPIRRSDVGFRMLCSLWDRPEAL